jgi:hypothetical protein
MRTDARGIEKLIQDAQQEGKFDDLACKGQKLHVGFGDLASVANDVMRDNGVVPEWITLSREIEALRARQAELVADLARRREADQAELTQALTSWEPASRSPGQGWRSSLRRLWHGQHSPSSRDHLTPPQLVERMEQDRRRVRFQFAALVRAERKKVDRYNLILAIGGRQMRRVRVEERLADFQERFPALSLVSDDGVARVEQKLDTLDPSLLVDAEDTGGQRFVRAPEQAQALHALRQSARKPPPIG